MDRSGNRHQHGRSAALRDQLASDLFRCYSSTAQIGAVRNSSLRNIRDKSGSAYGLPNSEVAWMVTGPNRSPVVHIIGSAAAVRLSLRACLFFLAAREIDEVSYSLVGSLARA